MQKYKIDPAKTSYYFCEFETAMIFVKSEYLREKESRIIPALPSGMDSPLPKEAHDEYRGQSESNYK